MPIKLEGVELGERKKKKTFLYEKKKRKGVWNRAAKCKQEEHSATFTVGSNVENSTIPTL